MSPDGSSRSLLRPFKSYFSSWNAFEVVFLIAGIIVPLTLGLVFHSSAIAIIAAITWIASSLFQAKGKIKGYLIGAVGLVLYAIISFRLTLYGEIAVSMGIAFPIMIFGFISWLRNSRRDKVEGEVVIIRKTKIREFALVILSQIIMGVGYYFLLGAFDTKFLILSVASLMANIAGEYLMARRTIFSIQIFRKCR